MSHCKVCNKEGLLISEEIGVCSECIKNKYDEAKHYFLKAHSLSRKFFKLPESVLKSRDGQTCKICVNKCTLAEGERGFCGAHFNRHGQLTGSDRGNYEWYHDFLPTNCVADWVCPGGTGSGYPEFAYRPGAEYGYKNLAVFMNNCNFNCLFCQNWQFREKSLLRASQGPDELARHVTNDTSCVCFFGGDPTPQIEFVIKSCEDLLSKRANKILRICFETNGSMSEEYLKKIIDISLQSGGCIKFDLKAWDEHLHSALCGVSNKRTLRNFKIASEFINKRREPPLLVASTLLVPGYVGADEVRMIAEFIASIDPTIPYTLLAFHPIFFMDDLPVTPKKHIEECYNASLEAGLKRVRVGNYHLIEHN